MEKGSEQGLPLCQDAEQSWAISQLPFDFCLFSRSGTGLINISSSISPQVEGILASSAQFPEHVLSSY